MGYLFRDLQVRGSAPSPAARIGLRADFPAATERLVDADNGKPPPVGRAIARARRLAKSARPGGGDRGSHARLHTAQQHGARARLRLIGLDRSPHSAKEIDFPGSVDRAAIGFNLTRLAKRRPDLAAATILMTEFGIAARH